MGSTCLISIVWCPTTRANQGVVVQWLTLDPHRYPCTACMSRDSRSRPARPPPTACGFLRTGLCILALVTLMCGLAAPVAAQVPATPEVLGTQGTGDGKFTLLWRDPGDVSITRYQYQHKIGSTSSWGSTWTTIPGSGPTTTSYEFTGLANFLNHYVKIRAVNANGPSDASNERFGSPTGQLPAPTGLAATAGDEEVVLRWTMPSGAWDSHVFNYQYQMKEGSAGNWGSWTESSRHPNLSTTHTVTGLTNGTTYYFKVRATDGITLGQASGEASATPAAAQRPATPLAPTLAVGDSQLTVTWIPPAANRAAITDYDVQYKTSSAANNDPWTNANYTGTGTSTTITGLANGTSYQVQVRARNSVGWSGWSPSASAIPVVVPAQVPATPEVLGTQGTGDGKFTLIWRNPGDVSITGYQYQHKIGSTSSWGSTWTTIPGSGPTTTSYEFTGLANFLNHYVKIRAVNANGPSDASNERFGSPTGQLPAPTGLAATAGDEEVVLRWTMPSGAWDSHVFSYQYQMKEGSAGSWGSWTESSRHPNLSTTHTVTGLTNGTTYDFKVRATDGITLGQASGEASATPAAAQRPATPLAPTLAVGDSQLTVTWIPPAANRAAITDYDVQFKTSSAAINDPWTDANYTGTGTSTTITGLTNGTSYQVQVLAKNRVGSSDWSPSASAIPVAVPATPVAPTLIPGDGQIQVSWNAPDNNGAAINDYDVRYKQSSDTSWIDANYNGTGTSATITGLTNGTSYLVQVRAKNSVGSSDWSHSSSTTLTTPAKPLHPILTSGDEQLTVEWTEPAANGAEVSDYDVQYSAGRSDGWTDHPHSGAGRSSVITGLTNGKSYQVRVRARNSVGWSGWSDPATGKPVTTPAAPNVPTLTPGHKQLTVAWTIPAANGAAISDYDVQYRAGNSGSWTDHPHSGTGWISVITGLTNGQSHQVHVRAKNSQGWSGWSSIATGTPVAVQAVWIAPSMPTDLGAVAGAGEVALSWSASTQGSGSIGYDLQFRPSGTGSWTRVPSGKITDTSHTIGGLANGTEYEFQVRAANQDPSGVWHVSAWTVAVQAVWIAPSMPTDLGAVAGAGEVALSWSASTQGSGSIGYDLQFRPSGTGSWTRVPSGKITDTSHTIGGLANGTEYEFQVRAANQDPSGVWHVSAWTTSVSATPVAVAVQAVWIAPSMPTDLGAVAGAGEVALSWSASTQGSGSIGYDLQFRPSGTGSWTRVPSGKITDTSHTIGGLANGTEYEFQVRAANQDPSGVWHVSAWTVSASAKPVTVAVQAVWIAPSMPTDLGAVAGAGEVALSWSASTQGSGSIGYDLQFRPSGTGSWTRVPSGKITDTSHTIGGLANGTEYEFQVRAANQDPSGVWHVSAWTTSVSATPVAVAVQAVWIAPSMPTDLGAVAGAGEVALSWSASTQGSGSIGYDLQFRPSGTGSWTRVPNGKITDTSHTIGGLANGTEYEFQVRAANQDPSGVWHVSAWTTSVSATPAAVAAASGSSAATPAAVAASAAASGSVAHFVPTVAVQVVNSVAARLAAPRVPGMQATLAGNKLPSWDGVAGMAVNPDPWTGARGRTGMGSRSLSAHEVVAGTSFAMTRGSADDSGFATVWGEGAMVRFERRHDGLTLDGAITSGFLGADWASERWLAGLAVGHSSSTGDYRGPDGSGKVKATLTGVYPYAGLRLTDELSAWAAAGHGTGKLTLKPGDGKEIETGLTMSMVAAGMRSTVLQPESSSGLSLALKGDARFTRTASDAAKGADGIHLAASDADIWQVRLGLEGSRHFALGNGRATATLSLEVGLRLDGGDAGRGFGADLGGGITFAEPESGLKLELKARGLIAHEAHDLREWEVSAALSYDKRHATERGLKMSLEQSWDAASSGGMESLLERGTLTGLTVNDNAPAKSRLVGEIGYGLAAFGDGFTGTPHAGFGYSSDGAHDYKVGWRLTPARPGGPSDPGFEFGFEVNRKEAANGDTTDQGAMLSTTIRW